MPSEPWAASPPASAQEHAAAHTGARYGVETVGNRIQSLTADLRRAERAGQASQVSELPEQLAYWQGIRSQQLADGTAGDLGSHTIKAGDIVQCGRAWYVVERASAKSVTLRGDFGPRRVAYHKLSGHRATSNRSLHHPHPIRSGVVERTPKSVGHLH